jgi:hypothetical protein
MPASSDLQWGLVVVLRGKLASHVSVLRQTCAACRWACMISAYGICPLLPQHLIVTVSLHMQPYLHQLARDPLCIASSC